MKKQSLINSKQELFCQYFSGIGQETFNNATISYMKAYDIVGIKYSKEYESAKTAGARLLTNVHISLRINEILDSYIKNEVVDRERAWVIVQRENPIAKIMAIKTYDEIKNRITKKIKISGKIKSNLNPKQMIQIAEQVLKKSQK